MKRIKTLLIILTIAFVTSAAGITNETEGKLIKNNCTVVAVETANNTSFKELHRTAKHTSLGVPNIDSSFKTWMCYQAVTNRKSPQYKLINTYGWVDEEGFMRCSSEKELGIEQDYYMIALGSYYGTKIGTKYRITLSTGKVFYGVLADCKDDRHTNKTNQYAGNNDVVEFIVDSKRLNSGVKYHGNVNVYKPLSGNIIKIEKIDFINE